MSNGSPHRPVTYDGLEGVSWVSYSELDFLAGLLPHRGLFLEIGTASGVTAAVVASRRPGLQVLCVDTFADHDLDHVSTVEGCRVDNWRRNRRPNMHLFVGSLLDLVTTFPGIRPDAVLVDGDHALDAVAADLDLAADILAAGGTLFAHDYGEPNLPEVTLAVDAFRRRWKFAEAGRHWTMLAMRRP